MNATDIIVGSFLIGLFVVPTIVATILIGIHHIKAAGFKHRERLEQMELKKLETKYPNTKLAELRQENLKLGGEVSKLKEDLKRAKKFIILTADTK